jgi:signal transduction histidine kinase
MDELLREVGEAFEPMAQEQGRPFTWRSDGPVVVRGAAQLLKRLLLNLVDNAFRHTPPTAAVCLALEADEAAARVQIRDEGPGIAAEDIPIVFQRFRRGTTARGGSGLGLAICREIATAHAGDIALESRVGTGTTVTVTLPREGGARRA